MTEMAPADSAFVTATAEISFHLHPSRTQMVTAGVQEKLDELILKYDTKLGGVVLGYSDVQVRDKRAKILPEGVVTLSGRNYVGLLVYNCFNASLRDAEICDTFSSPEPGNAPHPFFIHREAVDHRIEVGSRVRFMVLGTREEKQKSLVIDGTLKAPNTGNCEWMEKRKEAEGGGAEASGAVGGVGTEGADVRWSRRNTEAGVQMVDKDRHGTGGERGRESQGGAGKKEGGERAGKAGGGVDEAQVQEEEQEGVKKKKKKKKKRKVSEGENGVEEAGNEAVGGREGKGAMRIRKSEGGEELQKKGKKRKSV